MSNAFKISLAPDKPWQAINPLTIFQQPGSQLGLINIDLGNTQHPGVEQAIFDKVGSYGRQLGRIGDALEVILKHVNLEGLTQSETDALSVLMGQIAQVRQVKQDMLEGLPRTKKPRRARGLESSEPIPKNQARESKETPRLKAFCRVAPSVRFRVFAIFAVRVFFRTSVFSVCTCIGVHALRFDTFLAIKQLPVLRKGVF